MITTRDIYMLAIGGVAMFPIAFSWGMSMMGGWFVSRFPDLAEIARKRIEAYRASKGK